MTPEHDAQPPAQDPVRTPDRVDIAADDTVCPQCGESADLAKVKGCIKCLRCSFKFDCNGW